MEEMEVPCLRNDGSTAALAALLPPRFPTSVDSIHYITSYTRSIPCASLFLLSSPFSYVSTNPANLSSNTFSSIGYISSLVLPASVTSFSTPSPGIMTLE
jgi:hypothetical protein